jgi:hypothetical protein
MVCQSVIRHAACVVLAVSSFLCWCPVKNAEWHPDADDEVVTCFPCYFGCNVMGISCDYIRGLRHATPSINAHASLCIDETVHSAQCRFKFRSQRGRGSVADSSCSCFLDLGSQLSWVTFCTQSLGGGLFRSHGDDLLGAASLGWGWGRTPTLPPCACMLLPGILVIPLGLMGLLDSQLWSGRLTYSEVALLGFRCLGWRWGTQC